MQDENCLTLWDEALSPEQIPQYPTFSLKTAQGGEKNWYLDPTYRGAGVRTFQTEAKAGDLLRDSDLKFIPDWTDNLKFRIEVQNLAQTNPEYQKLQWYFCKSSILYFVNTFCWTYDPRLKNPLVPFVTYPFQDDMITWCLWLIKHRETGLIEKSRDMGATWCMEAVSLYMTLFYEGMVDYQLSLREEDVDNRSPDSLLGKLRFLLENLPDWMKGGWEPKKQDVDNKMIIRLPDSRSTIRGQLTGGTAGRSGRATRAFFDEFAFVEDAEKVLKAAASLSPSCLFLSTANGMGNPFYDMAHDSRVRKKSLHWTLHPCKDELWMKKERSKVSYTAESWAQEYDICYELSTQGRVFPEFVSFSASQYDWQHVQEGEFYEYDPHYDVIIGADFGMADPTSMVFAQIKPAPLHFHAFTKHCLVFFDEEEAGNKTVDEWAKLLRSKEYRIREFVGDYRTGNQRDATGNTWIKYLKQYGFQVSGRYNTEMGPIQEVKLLLNQQGALAVNKRTCPRLTMAFQNWAFPIDRTTKQIPHNAKPKHDQWSHSMKAVCYLVDWVYSAQKAKTRPHTKTEWDFRVFSA